MYASTIFSCPRSQKKIPFTASTVASTCAKFHLLAGIHDTSACIDQRRDHVVFYSDTQKSRWCHGGKLRCTYVGQTSKSSNNEAPKIETSTSQMMRVLFRLPTTRICSVAFTKKRRHIDQPRGRGHGINICSASLEEPSMHARVILFKFRLI